MKTGLDLPVVQYRGGAPAVADLLGGHVQVMFDIIADSIEHVRAGRLRALAIASATRSELLPDIPIMGDYVPGVEASFWAGIAAPKNTPVAIIDKLNKEINATLADPSPDISHTLFLQSADMRAGRGCEGADRLGRDAVATELAQGESGVGPCTA
jgi:tripartite-type tricarboxylate transporter receptor subunit TctC